MAKVFYYKLVVLLLATLSFSAATALIAILPSYFLSSVKNRIVNTKLEVQKQEPVSLPDQEALTVIKGLNDKLDLIERAKNDKYIISQKVINTVILKKTSSIKITEISYESDSKNKLLKNKKVTIGGTAASREALLAFRLALENDGNFKQVDLPVSNFVKGSNIKFYLSLVPNL